MRYLILADIHGNFEALTAVAQHADEVGYDDLLVLGDLVGYGAEPNAVVDWVRERTDPSRIIRGNHDKVVAQVEDGLNFNNLALLATEWTRDQLTPENLAYVHDLPEGPVEVGDGLVICHGSPLDEDEYVLSTDQAARIFEQHAPDLTFFGHTHLPTLVQRIGERVELGLLQGEQLDLDFEAEIRYLFNPGSVGQPRDRDPRAAYAVYDTEARRVQWRRVDYPIEEAQRKIQEAGLPPTLAYRLAVGV